MTAVSSSAGPAAPGTMNRFSSASCVSVMRISAISPQKVREALYGCAPMITGTASPAFP